MSLQTTTRRTTAEIVAEAEAILAADAETAHRTVNERDGIEGIQRQAKRVAKNVCRGREWLCDDAEGAALEAICAMGLYGQRTWEEHADAEQAARSAAIDAIREMDDIVVPKAARMSFGTAVRAIRAAEDAGATTEEALDAGVEAAREAAKKSGKNFKGVTKGDILFLSQATQRLEWTAVGGVEPVQNPGCTDSGYDGIDLADAVARIGDPIQRAVAQAVLDDPETVFTSSGRANKRVLATRLGVSTTSVAKALSALQERDF